MWDVKAGDEVVCIGDPSVGPCDRGQPPPRLPVRNGLYTVAKVWHGKAWSSTNGQLCDDVVAIQLIGYEEGGGYWDIAIFRKVQKRDIGVFRSLLAPTPTTPVKVREGA